MLIIIMTDIKKKVLPLPKAFLGQFEPRQPEFCQEPECHGSVPIPKMLKDVTQTKPEFCQELECSGSEPTPKMLEDVTQSKPEFC